MFCGLPSSVMKINVRHQLSLCTTIFCFQQIVMLEWEYLWSRDPKSWKLCVESFWSQKKDLNCPLHRELVMSPWVRWSLEEGPVLLWRVYILRGSAFTVSQTWDRFPHGSQTKFHMHFSCRNNNAFLAIWNDFPIHTRALKLSGGKGKHGKISQKWLFIFKCVIWNGGGQTLSSCHFNLDWLTRGYFGRRVKWRRFKFSHKVGKYILGLVRGDWVFFCVGVREAFIQFISSVEKKDGESPKVQRKQTVMCSCWWHGEGARLSIWTLANTISLLEVPARAELAVYC